MSANQALPLIGECENSARFLLKGSSSSLLDKPMAREVPKVTLHSLSVAVVRKGCEIVDAYDAELAHFRERVDFRASKDISSVAIRVLRAVTLLKSLFLPALTGDGWGTVLLAVAVLSNGVVGAGFCLADLLEL